MVVGLVVGSCGAGSMAMSMSGSRVGPMGLSLGWVEGSKVEVSWVAKEDSRSAIVLCCRWRNVDGCERDLHMSDQSPCKAGCRKVILGTWTLE